MLAIISDIHANTEALTAVLDDIERRGASALLVGGTGLYVRGVVDGFQPPPHYPHIAARLEAEPDTGALTRRLAELDPLALERIPPGNRRRIVPGRDREPDVPLSWSQAANRDRLREPVIAICPDPRALC